MESIGLVLMWVGAAGSIPPDEYWWLPSCEACEQFFKQAEAETKALLNLRDGLRAGWAAQQAHEAFKESDRVRMFWWSAWYVRYPNSPLQERRQHEKICREALAHGLNTLPLSLRR